MEGAKELRIKVRDGYTEGGFLGRKYEACKKSKFNGNYWNLQGRQYAIQGVYNLVLTKEINPYIEKEVLEDLERYLRDKGIIISEGLKNILETKLI